MTKKKFLSVDEIGRLVLGENNPCVLRYYALHLMTGKRADAVLQLPWHAGDARSKSGRSARPRRDRDNL